MLKDLKSRKTHIQKGERRKQRGQIYSHQAKGLPMNIYLSSGAWKGDGGRQSRHACFHQWNLVIRPISRSTFTASCHSDDRLFQYIIRGTAGWMTEIASLLELWKMISIKLARLGSLCVFSESNKVRGEMCLSKQAYLFHTLCFRIDLGTW